MFAGIPDTGAALLVGRRGSTPPLHRQGMGTVVTQIVCDVTGSSSGGLPDPADTALAPDAGNTRLRPSSPGGRAAGRGQLKAALDSPARRNFRILGGPKLGPANLVSHALRLRDPSRRPRRERPHPQGDAAHVGQAINPGERRGQIGAAWS
ncbi:MAG: hypothetical protein ACLVL7_11955 [Anaerotruncus massiliensis (ex Togo et al. 2019)]